MIRKEEKPKKSKEKKKKKEGNFASSLLGLQLLLCSDFFPFFTQLSQRCCHYR